MPEPANLDYQPPITRLLAYGDPRKLPAKPIVYPLELGLTREHVPELLRLMVERRFDELDSDNPAVWGPLHAWRALGQMKFPEAIVPLLNYNDIASEIDDDWFINEMPGLIAGFGEPAFAPLLERLSDRQVGSESRLSCSEALEKLGQKHPELRDRCVQALSQQLQRGADEEPDFNGLIVAALLELKAVEVAEIIEQAFAADWIDPMVVGTWRDVQQKFGLPPSEPEPPAPRRSLRAQQPKSSAPSGFQDFLKKGGSKRRRRSR